MNFGIHLVKNAHTKYNKVIKIISSMLFLKFLNINAKPL